MAENAANNNKNNNHNRSNQQPSSKKNINLNTQKTSSEEEINLLKNNVVIMTPIEGENGGDSGGGMPDAGGNGEANKNDVAVSVIGNDLTDNNSQSYKLMNKNKKNVFRGLYDRLLARFDITKKAENPFLTLFIVCLLLVVVLIVLIILWPRIPGYMKKDVCVESECLEASKQLLSWSNIKAAPCDNPYEWACGKFEDEYLNHKFYGMNKGEWNFDAHDEYEEISSINEFISKLPSGALSYSPQIMIKELHSYCTNLEILDSAEAKSSLKRAFKTIGGWKMLRDDYSSLWDVRQYLPLLQAKYGASPFYKISVESRNAPPYDNIITISEGDLGLPHKDLYSLDHRHPIIKAYHTLLQDVLSNLVTTPTEQSRMFTESMFNYEKRIARDIILTTKLGNTTQPQIKTINDLIKEAPSLPILDTVRSIFKIKITEHTPVLVKNLDVLRAMSQIVSTTDIEILNNFIAWSLTRQFLPYMSREYRVSLEEFNRVLYGVQSKQPIWYYCTKLVQKWIPFGLDAIRQNPSLIVYDSHNREYSSLSDMSQSESLITDKIRYDDELVKMMFYHIRNEYKSAINNANWINEKLTKYIIDKLSSLKLQIGIPDDLIRDVKFINRYYDDFSLQKIQFADNAEQHWTFKKIKMTELLGNVNDSLKIIAELFPLCDSCEKNLRELKYSINLNMVIISRETIKRPYFHHKYPISINFARLGTDISFTIHKAIYLMSQQYRSEEHPSSSDMNQNIVEQQAINCVEKNLKGDNKTKISSETLLNIFLSISSGNMVVQSLNSFLNKVEKNEPIYDSNISELVTYNLFDFKSNRRQPGLRQYDEKQMFSMAFLQKHCAVIDSSYKKFKILIENDIPEREKFELLWHQIPELRTSLDCSSSDTKCDYVL